MLTQKFDLTIARFYSFEQVIPDEVQQADIVELETFHPFGIYHSNQLNWKGDLTFFASAEEFIRSQKERKNLEESRNFFLSHGYTIEQTEVDEAQSKEFFELYHHTTLLKNRAIEYDTHLLVKKNWGAGIPVYLFGLYKDGKLESGLLVSDVKEELRVMFGAKKKFTEVRGGIGGVLEMELLRFAFEKGIAKVSHGLSTNPAGITDLAGIFEFKTRYGFTAFPVGPWQTTFILNDKAAQSDAVFLTVKNDQLCYLVLSKEATTEANKYQARLIGQTAQQPLAEHIQKSRQLFQFPSK